MARTKKSAPPASTDSSNATAVADAPAEQLDQTTPTADRAGADADEIGYDAMILLDAIFPSELNPRKHFDEADLQQLAESLLKHGQLQNLTVRPIDADNYELIGGERRYRAAKLAGLTAVRCRVIKVDDAMAVELRGIENYRRSQLNAIEEAIWFQQMIQIGKFNQTTLAEHLAITPGQVSNRLRLLKLPDEWQTMIMNGKLPPTHARVIVPWVERTEILATMYEWYEAETSTEPPSVEDFEGELVSLLTRNSRKMFLDWDGPKFALDDDVRQQLDIAEVPKQYGSGKVERAFNIALWDELQAKAEAALAEQRKTNQAQTSEASGLPSGSEVVTPANRPSQLSDWRLEQHLAAHVSAVLVSHIRVDVFGLRLFLACCGFNSGNSMFLEWLAGQQQEETDERILSDADLWDATKTITPKNLHGLAIDFLQWAFAEDHTPFDLQMLVTIATELKVDPFAKWVPDETLLDLCSENELRELFTEKMAPEKQVKKWGRARLIKEALDNWPPGYLPLLLKPDCLLTPTEAQAAAPAADDDDDDHDSDYGDE